MRLWAFKIDFEDLEKEICEPMADLKLGLDNLRKNATFRAILNVTLIIGNFLNNSNSKGFQIDYLAKVLLESICITLSLHVTLLILASNWSIFLSRCPRSRTQFTSTPCFTT